MPSYPYSLSLTNPGFETGDNSGWSVDLGSGTVPQALSGGHSGSYHAAVSSSDGRAAFYQDVTLPAEVLDDVDAGLLSAELTVWVSSSTGDADWARIEIECYSSASPTGADFLTRFQSGELDPGASWTESTVSGQVPVGTRLLRVQVEGEKDSGTELSVYVDDFALELAAAGRARVDLPVVNPSVAATGTTGWTASGVGVLSSTLYSFNPPCGDHFYGGTVAASYLEQDVAVPSMAESVVDAYGQSSYSADPAAGTEDCIFRFQALAAAGGADRLQVTATFLDASDSALGAYSSSDQTWSIDWEPVDLAVVPPVGTRTVRLRLDFTRIDGSVSDAGICGINAFFDMDAAAYNRFSLSAGLPPLEASDASMYGDMYLAAETPPLSFSGSMASDALTVAAVLPAPEMAAEMHPMGYVAASALPMPAFSGGMSALPAISVELPAVSFHSLMIGAWTAEAELPCPETFFAGAARMSARLPAVDLSIGGRANWRAAAELPVPTMAADVRADGRVSATLPPLTAFIAGAARLTASLPMLESASQFLPAYQVDAATPCIEMSATLRADGRMTVELPFAFAAFVGAGFISATLPAPTMSGASAAGAKVAAWLPAPSMSAAWGWQASTTLPAPSIDAAARALWRISAELPLPEMAAEMYPHRSMVIIAELPALTFDGSAFNGQPRFGVWRHVRP